MCVPFPNERWVLEKLCSLLKLLYLHLRVLLEEQLLRLYMAQVCPADEARRS